MYLLENNLQTLSTLKTAPVINNSILQFNLKIRRASIIPERNPLRDKLNNYVQCRHEFC